MAEWISHWGFVAVFVGAATEGDLTMVLAGASCHLGLLRLPQVIAIGFAGSLASDAFVFALARAYAERIHATALYRRTAPRLERLVDRFGPRQILFARFVYGTRVPTMLIWGTRRLSWTRFLTLAPLGCAAWASAVALVGFASSRAASTLVGEVERVELRLLGVLLVGATIAVLIRLLRRRGTST
jgi:membrane protein DedA with SNARE-associated domain